VTVACCAPLPSITRAASGCTPQSGTRVLSGSVIRSSSTDQDSRDRPVEFPVGLQGLGGADHPSVDISYCSRERPGRDRPVRRAHSAVTGVALRGLVAQARGGRVSKGPAAASGSFRPAREGPACECPQGEQRQHHHLSGMSLEVPSATLGLDLTDVFVSPHPSRWIPRVKGSGFLRGCGCLGLQGCKQSVSR
jgi:hypothetical protein